MHGNRTSASGMLDDDVAARTISLSTNNYDRSAPETENRLALWLREREREIFYGYTYIEVVQPIEKRKGEKQKLNQISILIKIR